MKRGTKSGRGGGGLIRVITTTNSPATARKAAASQKNVRLRDGLGCPLLPALAASRHERGAGEPVGGVAIRGLLAVVLLPGEWQSRRPPVVIGQLIRGYFLV